MTGRWTIGFIGMMLFFTEFSLQAFSDSSSASSHFVQKEFVISGWGDMPMDKHGLDWLGCRQPIDVTDAQVKQNYQDMADADFNMVLNFYVRGDDNIHQLLDVSQENNMKVLVWRGDENFEDKKTIEEKLTNHPACLGYFLWDEPSTDRFGKMAEQIKVIRKLRPGKLAFVNLFPAYANPSQLKAKDYETYLKSFIQTCHPDVLCVDHYPLFRPDHTSDSRDGYCENLRIISHYAQQANIPFWWFFYTTPHNNLPEPTEAQLRWQIYTAITYGAKGLFYYEYFRPFYPSPVFNKDSALIDASYRKNRLYTSAEKINARIKNWGPVLMDLQSVGVFRRGNGFLKKHDADLLNDVTLSKAGASDPELNLLIGVFKRKDGQKAFMITNYEYAYTAWISLQKKSDSIHLVEIDPKTGKEIPVYDESLNIPGTQISLDAGEGRLFLIEK